MEYLGTIYKGSQSDIIFPVPFIELSDGATVDFYTDGDGGFSRTKDEIKIDNYMLRTTASADELNSLNDGVLNYTINTCMGKSEGDTGLYLSEPTSYVDKQYLTADGVKTINGESIVGQGNIEIQGGGSEDYIIQLGSGGTITNLNLTNEQITEVGAAINDGKKIYIVEHNKQSKYTVFEQVIYNGHITLHYGLSSYRTYMWVGDINFVTPQRTTTYNLQSQIGSNTFLFARDINLKNNQGVDNILTNLKKDIFISGFDLSKNANSIYTVDGNFDTIKTYFTTHQIKGIDTTGEIFNLDFRLKTDGTLAASYINRDKFSNVNNKIYTFILSPNSDDKSKMNVQNYITSFDDIYDKINKTSDIVNDFDKRISVTEDDLNTLSGSVVNNYYTKTEVDEKIDNISGGTSDDSNFKKLRIDISGKTLEQDFMPLFNYLDGIPNSPDMLGCINLILDGKLYIPTRIETEVSSKGYFILIYATGTIDAKRVELFKDSADSEYTNVYIKNYELYSDAGNGSSIFIPTTSGNAGQILKSNGEKQIPTWVDFSEYSYTKEEIDSKIGDINNILETI